MIVMPKANAPIVSGTFEEPGGATVANSAGKSAVSIVPMFCAMAMPETRARVGKSDDGDLGVAGWEEDLREDQRGGGRIDEEVIIFERRSDPATCRRDFRLAQTPLAAA
jgi:hypothetical protein